jgi:hypothetical protein
MRKEKESLSKLLSVVENAGVPKRGDKNDVDAEVDYHGCTVEQMRHALQQRWPEWRGMRRVRVIHGQGLALKPALLRWCRERGIPFAPEPHNPGSTYIYPASRQLTETSLTNTLAEKGLRLTPEQEAALRDPQAALRAQQEACRRQQEEERRKHAEEANRKAQQRRDEALWQAEMARLDALDKRHSQKPKENGEKPSAPILLPPTVIKHQEGYWRAELVRVADTDTETLQKQKRTGLDKLAPPLETKPPQKPSGAPASAPKRDEAADRALFEAEMARLAESDTQSVRRTSRD